MFVDGRSVSQGETIETQICIIGAGAIGIAMILDWLHTPLKVTVVESGDFDFQSQTQSLFDVKADFLPIGSKSCIRQFGGTTNAWSGRWKSHDEIDFEKRNWVPNSGWPISRKDLDPFYKHASKLLGAPPADEAPLKEYANSYINSPVVKTSLMRAFKKENWNFARNFKQQIVSANNTRVFLNSNLVNLDPASNGKKINRAEIECLNGKKYFVNAKIFILAAGGIENARVLLMSNKKIKKGVGNLNDQVGRYFMEHPKGVIGQIQFGKPAYLPLYWGYNSSFAGLPRGALVLSSQVQKKYKILNSQIFLEPTYNYPSTLRPILNNIPAERIDSLLNLVGQHLTVWQAQIRNFMEQAPHPGNRIYLANERDLLGCPKAKIRWKIGELDKKTMIIFHRLLHSELERLKIGKLTSPLLAGKTDSWPISKDASHQMGATRMGDNPKSSVVSANCQVHEIVNLYLAGNSVLPTSGYANPTATSVALALRLTNYLKKKYG